MAEITLVKNNESYSLRIDEVSVGGAWVGNTDLVPAKEFMRGRSKAVMGFYIKLDNRQNGLGQNY